jgi:hypothetical protein
MESEREQLPLARVDFVYETLTYLASAYGARLSALLETREENDVLVRDR